MNPENLYNIVKHLPLYKRKGREEVFLGIVKSKAKNWIGWQYIQDLRNLDNFNELLIETGLYQLALNHWFIQTQNGKEVTFEILKKNYDI